MIIDCDTHFMPKDAFDYLDPSLSDRKPLLKFDEQGLLADIEFAGKPPQVPGTTPLPAPGSGGHYPGNTDMGTRLKDYERMGIEGQFIVPQFTGWWSFSLQIIPTMIPGVG